MEKFKIEYDFSNIFAGTEHYRTSHKHFPRPRQDFNVCLAEEVDALLADVRALVEAAKIVEPSVDILNGRRVDVSSPIEMLTAWNGVFSTLENIKQAIAAVEAHLKEVKSIEEKD